ncbi:MAG: ATP-binding protein, partial [Marmoricola sp.]
MRFSGTDQLLAEHGPDRVADDLDRSLRIAQAAFEAEDVALLCVDADKDGGKLFVSSGVPLTSQDDEGRMLRAAQAIMAAKPPLPLQIGINRGHVFAAEVGSPRRAGFSAMGDTTNTAARICAKASPGEILVHPSVLEHARTLYATEPVGPFTFKGKTQPQLLYRLGEEIGPRELDHSDELPLIGRAAELAEILKVAQIQEGRGATIEILGPVGVGKTRLLNEVVRGLPALPMISLHAEPYGAASYRVFRDPIRALLGVERGEQPAMATALLRTLADVAPHLVEVAALIGDVAQVEIEPSDAVRAILPAHRGDRIADAVIDLLTQVHPTGLSLVMEDAQWADPSSSTLLSRIAAETTRRPWLVLISQRSAQRDAELVEPDLRIQLEPLADDAVRALAVVMTETAPLRPDELALVVARADGSPLFAREMIRAGQELGSLEAVPSSLQGAVAAQVDVLDPTTRRALAYASVLGRSFRGSVFRELLEAEGVALTEQTLERLERFLTVDAEDRWQFRHGVLSEVVYDGLGYNLRARLHLDAGEAIERLSADLVADADTLALHFSRGGRQDKAYDYASRAAERSEAAFASMAAASQLTLALDAARRIHLPANEIRQLWMRLATARENAGILDGALDALRQAGRLAGSALEDGHLWLRRADVRERMASYSPALRDGARARAAVEGLRDREAATIRARELALVARVRMRQEKAADALAFGL